MATDRQHRLVLAAVLVVLALVLYRAYSGGVGTAGTATSPSNTRASSTRASTGAETAAAAPDVHLQALTEERPVPAGGERGDLFRFGQRRAPAPVSTSAPGPVVMPVPPTAGPPAPAPIPLRFIGIVESPRQSKRLAALVDTTGHAYQGAEGDIVAGQYRVLKIGVESIELSYLDGRGQQTIRLSGS
jgi:hypothetical protein